MRVVMPLSYHWKQRDEILEELREAAQLHPMGRLYAFPIWVEVWLLCLWILIYAGRDDVTFWCRWHFVRPFKIWHMRYRRIMEEDREVRTHHE